MSAPIKFLIGLVAALLAAWVWHGPAGQSEKLASRLETEARALVAMTELEGVSVRLERAPLSRALIVSGQANELQREGLGSQNGVLDHARAAEGVGTVRWDDEPKRFLLPLLAETMLVAALAYLVGFCLGALLFNRRRRQSFLD
ncbi:MAG TPA: hypothetical protein VEZ70_13890 [Allosphingosinicella sp.]|nr:hypothetical protein [Allosphingosinicella sp.]